MTKLITKQEINKELTGPDMKESLSLYVNEHNSLEQITDSIASVYAKSPDLQEIPREQFYDVAKRCLQIGLLPDTVKNHANILIRKVKQGNTWVKQPQLIIQYHGFLELASRCGVKINSGVIHEKDKASFITISGNRTLKVEHAITNKGKAVAFFATCTIDGVEYTEVMDNDDILPIKEAVKTDFVWNKNYNEMARKTVIRRLVKHTINQFKANEWKDKITQAEQIDNETIDLENIKPVYQVLSDESYDTIIDGLGKRGIPQEKILDWAKTQGYTIKNLGELPQELANKLLAKWEKEEQKQVTDENKG